MEEQSSSAGADKKVVIYTTATCGYCKAAKAFLNEHNISFEEYDVGTDMAKREEMVEKSGQMGVPVITVGDELMVGFDEKKLAELVGV
ncbi:NrdH-redoxin [Candidatus Wolfebacteria bacterium]|nr:MAG: NrdH-redoxin [Candidatus Wolfebacteria bacterium]